MARAAECAARATRTCGSRGNWLGLSAGNARPPNPAPPTRRGGGRRPPPGRPPRAPPPPAPPPRAGAAGGGEPLQVRWRDQAGGEDPLAQGPRGVPAVLEPLDPRLRQDLADVLDPARHLGTGQ